jgi:hypothetical protein
MDTPLSALVEQVVNAKSALRESVRQPLPELNNLIPTPAFKTCAEFLGEDPDNPDLHRVLSLLLTLAVLQSSDPCSRKEGLCLLGVRGVDAYECERGERRTMAALARRKPLHDVDWYVRRHLPRTLARITGHLHALVRHPELLEEALACDGKTALIKHVY